MSFLSKIGQDMEKDRKLVMLRKKYFHDILQFNQKQQQRKKVDAQKQKHQSDNKILRINQEALQALQSQKLQKFNEKIGNQSQLKYEYERQIKEKIQMRRQQKQLDKQYIKLQEIETEKASQRRLQDLLKVYQRNRPDVTHRRVKTEALKEIDNPQVQKQLSRKSRPNMSSLGLLPSIQKTFVSQQQNRQNQNKKWSIWQKHRFILKTHSLLNII